MLSDSLKEIVCITAVSGVDMLLNVDVDDVPTQNKIRSKTIFFCQEDVSKFTKDKLAYFASDLAALDAARRDSVLKIVTEMFSQASVKIATLKAEIHVNNGPAENLPSPLVLSHLTRLQLRSCFAAVELQRERILASRDVPSMRSLESESKYFKRYLSLYISTRNELE